MQYIWNFFENMDEFVYVSDADTFELIYMNKKLRDMYGISAMEELAGRKCYDILQNCSSPCTICNNEQLKQGFFKEWRYYNPLLDRYLMLKDTMEIVDGRRYRIEIAIDLTAEKHLEGIGENYHHLETLINEGLRVALQAPTPDDSLDVALEYLGKALNGERTYIFERNKEGGDDNTYEWTSNGVTAEKDNLQDLPPEVCAGWYRKFSNNQSIEIEDLEDIKERDPNLYGVLKPQNIHSLAVVPLYADNKVIGFYGVDNPPSDMLEYATNMLQIMGHFIVSCLKRRNLVRQLQEMSYTDQLTKLGNRYAMNEYVKHLQPQDSVGVVYCDITGLKQVNDSAGHDAGDKLILRACECLEETFGGYGLFRIGGDELLAICPQMSKEELQGAITRFKESMRQYEVVIAVGEVWHENSDVSMEMLLAQAESRMYKDKTEYYKHVGIHRRY